MYIVDEDVVDVVFEDRRLAIISRLGVVPDARIRAALLYSWKVASCEYVEQRCLSACTVASANACQCCLSHGYAALLSHAPPNVQEHQLALHRLRPTTERHDV